MVFFHQQGLEGVCSSKKVPYITKVSERDIIDAGILRCLPTQKRHVPIIQSISWRSWKASWT